MNEALYESGVRSHYHDVAMILIEAGADIENMHHDMFLNVEEVELLYKLNIKIDRKHEEIIELYKYRALYANELLSKILIPEIAFIIIEY